MFNLVRILALLSTILMVGCATGPSGKAFDSAIGEWTSKVEMMESGVDKETMIIVDESRATYSARNGRIQFYAVDDQGKWEGYWIETALGAASCTVDKDGDSVWGVAIFQFNAQFNEFTGTWDLCGEGKKYSWNGYR
jgi:hypothetical protein